MTLSKFTTAIAAVLILSLHANADIVDSLDFSIDGQGSTHDNTGSDPVETSPISGGVAPNDWVLTFPNPSSDGTTNEFITDGGVIRVQDWGGEGTVTGGWIATADGTVDITGTGLSIGEDAFNISTEGITWFYSLNGSPAVEVFLGNTELGGPVGAGTDVGNTFTGVAVAAGDTLDYGFTVNVNGTGDGVEISSVEVDFTAVPEPSSAILLGLAGLTIIRRRRS